MKIHHLIFPVCLLVISNCFSQSKPLEEKVNSASSATVVHPALQQKSFQKETVVPNGQKLVKVEPPIKAIKGTTPPTDLTKATLLNAFVTVQTGTSAQTFPVTSGENKDKDTHWSCGIFDQNDKPITSFHDDSDNDEYEQGSVTGPLKMHIDNASVLGDFTSDGHIHINIAPNGNDTWGITQFTLTLDFQNPQTTQKINWGYVTLSQDKRDIDLRFYYDGKNLVARQ